MKYTTIERLTYQFIETLTYQQLEADEDFTHYLNITYLTTKYIICNVIIYGV